MNYKNIQLNKGATESLKEVLKLRGDNMSLYALKLIESFENTEDNPIKDNRIVSDRPFLNARNINKKANTFFSISVVSSTNYEYLKIND